MARAFSDDRPDNFELSFAVDPADRFCETDVLTVEVFRPFTTDPRAVFEVARRRATFLVEAEVLRFVLANRELADLVFFLVAFFFTSLLTRQRRKQS